MAWSPDYCTTEELSSFLRVPGLDDQDEVFQAVAISAASRAIDRACHRQFGKDDAPTTRYYTASFDRQSRRWVVDIDDLMNVSGLVVAYDQADDQTYDSVVQGYRLAPINAVANGMPWTGLTMNHGASPGLGGIEHGVRVTGSFGWSAVPAGIKQATLLQASRLLARRDSPYGIAGSPDVGSELRLLAKLDPDVEVSVTPYKRSWWVA